MKEVGGALFFFGVGSIVLYFIHMEFRLLSWITNWGDGVAWGIRVGMVVVGGALWLLGRKTAAQAA